MCMNLLKNVILSGVFSIQSPDTSGEVLDVAGADIDQLPGAVLNTEHINPPDAEKSSTPEDFKGFQSIVGKVLNAKKIFSKNDCSNDLELTAWNKFQRPMIYGSVEIFDGEDAHPNARAAASLARMFNKSTDGQKLGLSVEGATLKREGHVLKRTLIRNMALTMRPCNKAATIDIVKDTADQSVHKSLNIKTVSDAYEPLQKSIALESMQFTVQYEQNVVIDATTQLFNAVNNLRKTLTAGGGNAAPGSLTNGSALQPEHQSSQLTKLVKLIGRKPVNRGDIKKAIPEMSDEDCDKVLKAFKAQSFQKNLDLVKNLYEEMTGKKAE